MREDADMWEYLRTWIHACISAIVFLNYEYKQLRIWQIHVVRLVNWLGTLQRGVGCLARFAQLTQQNLWSRLSSQNPGRFPFHPSGSWVCELVGFLTSPPTKKRSWWPQSASISVQTHHKKTEHGKKTDLQRRWPPMCETNPEDATHKS